MKRRGRKARRTGGAKLQNGVRPFEHLERLAECLNYPRQWLAERQQSSGLLAAMKAAGDEAHFGERRYGAWCAAAAILEPSLPLRGWPGDEPLRSLELRSRHIRRHQDGHQPLIRSIASETARRFNRLATVAPVRLWITDPVAEARKKGQEAETAARTLGVRLHMPRIPFPPMWSPRLRGTEDPRGEVVERLWHLLRDPDADRLKRCQRCGTWFADTSKKLGQLYCSRACVNRAWSRAARRAAGHRLKPRRMKRPTVNRKRGFR